MHLMTTSAKQKVSKARLQDHRRSKNLETVAVGAKETNQTMWHFKTHYHKKNSQKTMKTKLQLIKDWIKRSQEITSHLK